VKAVQCGYIVSYVSIPIYIKYVCMYYQVVPVFVHNSFAISLITRHVSYPARVRAPLAFSLPVVYLKPVLPAPAVILSP